MKAQKGRVKWPIVQPPSSEPESTSSEVERLSSIYNKNVADEQARAVSTHDMELVVPELFLVFLLQCVCSVH